VREARRLRGERRPGPLRQIDGDSCFISLPRVTHSVQHRFVRQIGVLNVFNIDVSIVYRIDACVILELDVLHAQ
jgi:hypothetical protein